MKYPFPNTQLPNLDQEKKKKEEKLQLQLEI